MPKQKRSSPRTLVDDALFAGKPRARAPHEFVLDAIASLAPTTRPMFGCLAVYVEDKIVLILRDKEDTPTDNGVWLATAVPHHASLRYELPHLRSIQLFGKSVTDWQVIPTDAADFEQSALNACALIIARDPRIGKVPRRPPISRSRGKARTTRGSAKRSAKSTNS
jgi:hypothetical protein